MCGVIVVDAGRSWSTNLGRDAYLITIAWIFIIIWGSINCPIVIFSPTICYFSRERPLVKPTPPGPSFSYIRLCDLFSFAFIFRSIKPKIQKYVAALYFISDLFIQSITTFSRPRTNFWRRYPKVIDKPFNMSGASGCYLCARAVYIVLLCSSTGSITLVSYLREIPTAAVLHHPFLFGEIPT